jgi:hypothetical protein
MIFFPGHRLASGSEATSQDRADSSGKQMSGDGKGKVCVSFQAGYDDREGNCQQDVRHILG